MNGVVARPTTVRGAKRPRLDAWQVSVVVLLVLLAVAVTGWTLAEERVANAPSAAAAAKPVASGPLTPQVLRASRVLTTDIGAYLAARPPVVVSDASERLFVQQDQGHVSQIWSRFHSWNFWFSAAVAHHYTQFDGSAEIAYRYALATWIADQRDILSFRYHCFDSVPYNGGMSKVIPCWNTELRGNSAQWTQDASALAAAWDKLTAANRASLPSAPWQLVAETARHL